MLRRCAVIALASCALLLAGCVQLSTEVRVEDDGSGTFRTLVAVNQQEFEQALSAVGGLPEGETLIPSLEEVQAGLPPGAIVEPYSSGDFQGYVVTAPFANPAELQSLMSEVSGDQSATPVLGNVVLEPDGDGWRFQAESAGGASSLLTGPDGGSSPLSDDQLQSLLGDAVIEVAVHLPGHVVESNADRVTSDGTLVWELASSDGTRTLTARSEAGDPATGDGAPPLVDTVGGATTATGGGTGATSAGGASGDDAASESAGSGGTAAQEDDGGGSGAAVLAIVAVVVVAAIVALVLVLRRRSATPAPAMAGSPLPPLGPTATPPYGSSPSGPAPWPPAPGPRGSGPVPGPGAYEPHAASPPTAGPEADPWGMPAPPPPDMGATRIVPTWATDPDAMPGRAAPAAPQPPPGGPAGAPPPPPPGPSGPPAPPHPPAPPQPPGR